MRGSRSEDPRCWILRGGFFRNGNLRKDFDGPKVSVLPEKKPSGIAIDLRFFEMTVFKYTLIAFASVILQIGNIYATQDASIKEGDSVNGNWSKNEVYGGSSAIVALVEFNLSGFSKDDIVNLIRIG